MDIKVLASDQYGNQIVEINGAWELALAKGWKALGYDSQDTICYQNFACAFEIEELEAMEFVNWLAANKPNLIHTLSYEEVFNGFICCETHFLSRHDAHSKLFKLAYNEFLKSL